MFYLLMRKYEDWRATEKKILKLFDISFKKVNWYKCVNIKLFIVSVEPVRNRRAKGK